MSDNETFVLPDGKTPLDRLLALRKNGNRHFVSSLHPGVDNVLGLRVPDVRALAKEIAAADWRTYLRSAGSRYMEERMLHGLVLGQIKPGDADSYLELVSDFVGKINSWSVCDTFDFAGKGKFVARHYDKIWQWLLDYLTDSREYAVRFGVVMLMKYYVDESIFKTLLERLADVRHDGYYVRMAVAWALSVAFVKHPSECYVWLKDAPLDDFTFSKTISKICDSYRVSPSDKALVRALRDMRKSAICLRRESPAPAKMKSIGYIS